MEGSQTTKLVRLLVGLALGNLVLGVLIAVAGLYGVFWGTLAQAGQGFQEAAAGMALPQEYLATPFYFWWHVVEVVVGLGLIVGAAAMVQRWPGGRALNVFVAAGGLGLLTVAAVGGLLRGWSDWGWALVRMGYLVLLVALLWRRWVKEAWRRPAEVRE